MATAVTAIIVSHLWGAVQFCHCNSGDVWLYSTPILHCSEAARDLLTEECCKSTSRPANFPAGWRGSAFEALSRRLHECSPDERSDIRGFRSSPRSPLINPLLANTNFPS